MTARGIRNNNPGNIRHGQKWLGLAPQQSDPAFCQFVTMAYGIRALIVLLKTYRSKYGLKTVRGIISRWAPPNENDTEAYIRAVCAAASIGPDDVIPDNQDTYHYLAREIAKHENGPQAAALITADQWREGLALAFGGPAQSQPVTEQSLTITEPPMAPFIAAALPAIISAVPDLLSIFGDRSKESSTQYQQAAEKVVDIAIKATGAANAQEAAEKISADPKAADAVREAVRENWYELSEAGGGGIAGAREFNLKASEIPFWKQPAFVISLMLLAPVYMLLVDVFFVHAGAYSGELRVQVVTAVLAIIGLVGAFWLGSSMSSRAKDEALIGKK